VITRTVLGFVALAISLVALAGDPSSAAPPTSRGAIGILFSSGARPDLYVVNPDTGTRARLTSGPLSHVGAVWSPDGKRIAFVGYRGSSGASRSEIYTLDVRRKSLRRLTHNTVADTQPVWSPSGTRIAFLERPFSEPSLGGSQRDVMVVNANGSGLRRVTTDSSAKSQVAWSPNERYLSFVASRGGGRRLFVVDLATRSVHQIADNATDASWSPRGQRMAFSQSLRDGVHLIVVRADGSGARSLTHVTTGWIAQSAWSPDGSEIAFTRGRVVGSTIEAVRAAGGKRRMLTRPGRHADSLPDWSPDGRRLVFVRHRFDRSAPRIAELAVVGREGRRIRVLPNVRVLWGSDPVAPRWQPAPH